MLFSDPVSLGILGLAAFLLLLFIGTPIGIGMAAVGFLGIAIFKGYAVALNTLFTIPYSATASWLLSVIPMFILMGNAAFYAGFTKDAYDCAYLWVGRYRGGLGVATLVAATAFGACSGCLLTTMRM